MALTAQVNFPGGVKSLDCQMGTFKFDTTDVTTELPVRFTKIYGISLIPVGAITAGNNQNLSVAETIAADGSITVPADGNITVNRTLEGSGTAVSALGVCYVIWGNK